MNQVILYNHPDAPDAQIARYFYAREFACPHCKTIAIDPRLLSALVWLRDIIQSPIRINSAFRCPMHNASVGGSAGSQHLLGKAADIQVAGLNAKQLAEVAESVPYFRQGGIITMRNAIHVDTRSTPYRGHSER